MSASTAPNAFQPARQHINSFARFTNENGFSVAHAAAAAPTPTPRPFYVGSAAAIPTASAPTQQLVAQQQQKQKSQLATASVPPPVRLAAHMASATTGVFVSAAPLNGIHIPFPALRRAAAPRLPQQQQESTDGTFAATHTNTNKTAAAAVSEDPRKVLADRFKTRPCANYEATGACPYAHRCMFAHGPHEARTAEENVRDGLFTEEAIKSFRRAQRIALRDKALAEAKEAEQKQQQQCVANMSIQSAEVPIVEATQHKLFTAAPAVAIAPSATVHAPIAAAHPNTIMTFGSLPAVAAAVPPPAYSSSFAAPLQQQQQQQHYVPMYTLQATIAACGYDSVDPFDGPHCAFPSSFETPVCAANDAFFADDDAEEEEADPFAEGAYGDGDSLVGDYESADDGQEDFAVSCTHDDAAEAMSVEAAISSIASPQQAPAPLLAAQQQQQPQLYRRNPYSLTAVVQPIPMPTRRAVAEAIGCVKVAPSLIALDGVQLELAMP